MKQKNLQTIEVTMTLTLKPGSEKYIIASIEDGMEFEEGEGIVSFDIDIVDNEDEDNIESEIA